MNSFETLIAQFAEKTSLALTAKQDGSVDLVVDGIDVSVQSRPDRDDCVIFTLPVDDTEIDLATARRALELAANGEGTEGHYLGVKAGMFVLSAIVPLAGLSSEDFANRLITLARASRYVAREIALALAPEGGPGAVPAIDSSPPESFFLRV
jgi:hypothetical protein